MPEKKLKLTEIKSNLWKSYRESGHFVKVKDEEKQTQRKLTLVQVMGDKRARENSRDEKGGGKEKKVKTVVEKLEVERQKRIKKAEAENGILRTIRESL